MNRGRQVDAAAGQLDGCEKADAEGDYMILHRRFSGFGLPVNWVVADVLRIEDGALAEHSDVIQDEATPEPSKSGRPMFGDSFPASI